MRKKCSVNPIDYTYFITTKNDCYPEAACFVGKCLFCLDILPVKGCLNSCSTVQ